MSNATPREELDRAISAREYLALGFGTIIGVGWVIVLGDWLTQAAPGGAMLAFALGGVAMMLVGFCYAELATRLPVAGGEMAYAYEIFGLKASFMLGWTLSFVWIAFTAFEGVAFGWLVGTLAPGIEGPLLYFSRGEPVRLGSLLLGLGGMAVLTYFNYRGARAAVRLQKVFIYAFILLCGVFIVAGVGGGSTLNLEPLFRAGGKASVASGVIAVFVTTPVWYAGFNVIPQAMEERAARTSLRSVGNAIVASIGLAAVFYCLVILSASMAAPWQGLVSLDLPAAGAFEAAMGSSWLANLVLFAALLGILTTWNAVFIAGARLLFAMGRARIILPGLGRVRPHFSSPGNAVLFVGGVGSLGLFLGRSAILPIVNVGATCFAFAFLCSCLGLIKLRRARPGQAGPFRVPGGSATAIVAAGVVLLMLFMSLYQPYAAADGRIPLEWVLLGGWALLGLVFWSLARGIRANVDERERRELIFGAALATEESADSISSTAGSSGGAHHLQPDGTLR